MRSSPREPPTILLVEDQPQVRTTLHKWLTRRIPFAVVLAVGDAARAMGILATRHVDLIISDYVLPGTDGITFLARASEVAGDVPRLLLSGHLDEESASRAVNIARVHALFIKPALGEDFADRVSELVAQHRRKTIPYA